jgi:hypothetical protein
MRKAVTELHFSRTSEPMATVEIDIDSLPANAYGCSGLVGAALAPLAAQSPQLPRYRVCTKDPASISATRPTVPSLAS